MTVIRAHDIATLLDRAPPEIRILSLDCFDTLIWRNVNAPIDVFADLPVAGGGIEPRVRAERLARRLRKVTDGFDEVSIEAIHAALQPHEAERAASVEAELEAEARHCYPFAPTVALIEAARARGLRVIIVSDTYLAEPQLRGLIARVAGQSVAEAIERIFCSSEYGLAKAQGLFEPVLEALGVAPETILHLGDNPVADAQAPVKLGIHGVHFQQFPAGVQQQLRLEAAAATLIEPRTRVTLPAFQPHRPALSLGIDEADAATRLGHDVLGPILHGFANWVRREAETLAARTGRRVRPVFVLRDGYLPARAYEAAGHGAAASIELSRFTARRASFTDEAAIRGYLAREATPLVKVIGRQLLIDVDEMQRLPPHPKAFRAKILEPQWVRKIISRSRQFAERLAKHIERETGIVAGEQLMLVDLGYQGTVQDMIEPVLSARLKIGISGRYLLLRELEPTPFDKRGLLDPRHFDGRVLGAMIRQISVIEQLVTIAQGSVVDYHANGKPIRKAADIKGRQSLTREAAQAGCLRFAANHAAGKARPAGSDDEDSERRMVASVLARLLLLPRAEEVALIEAFDHDVNLGTNYTTKLIDRAAARRGLQARGLTYLSGMERMYPAGEIQEHGLPLALSFAAIGTLGLDFRQSDFQSGAETVPVMIADARAQLMMSAEAVPTHDGHYRLSMPINPGAYAIGLQLGAIAEVAQIGTVAIEGVDEFVSASERAPRIATPLYDGMEKLAEGLYRLGPNAIIFVPPAEQGPGDKPMLLTLTYRPIVRRAKAAAAHAVKEVA
ncbi:MAG: HAD family hydrolase [Sphingomonas sp.]|nr:HAD family hydrolase [Sphingomonas sp.]